MNDPSSSGGAEVKIDRSNQYVNFPYLLTKQKARGLAGPGRGLFSFRRGAGYFDAANSVLSQEVYVNSYLQLFSSFSKINVGGAEMNRRVH